MLSNALVYLGHHVTDYVLAALRGPRELGLYSVAYQIANLPTTELVFPLGRAVFPGYAQMASSVIELRRGFLDVFSVITLAVTPAGMILIVLAEPAVQVLLGPQWDATVPLMRVLGAYGIIRAWMSNTGAVYLAVGKPRITTLLSCLYLSMLLPALLFFIDRYGTLGASYAVVLAASIQAPVAFQVILSRLELSIGDLFALVWRPLAGAATMALAVVLIREACCRDALPILQLGLLLPVALAVYVAAVYMLWVFAGTPRTGEIIIQARLRQIWAPTSHRAR
jgi:O-antigen/teichoic acid export membrane protein